MLRTVGYGVMGAALGLVGAEAVASDSTVFAAELGGALGVVVVALFKASRAVMAWLDSDRVWKERQDRMGVAILAALEGLSSRLAAAISVTPGAPSERVAGPAMAPPAPELQPD